MTPVMLSLFLHPTTAQTTSTSYLDHCESLTVVSLKSSLLQSGLHTEAQMIVLKYSTNEVTLQFNTLNYLLPALRIESKFPHRVCMLSGSHNHLPLSLLADHPQPPSLFSLLGTCPSSSPSQASLTSVFINSSSGITVKVALQNRPNPLSSTTNRQSWCPSCTSPIPEHILLILMVCLLPLLH